MVMSSKRLGSRASKIIILELLNFGKVPFERLKKNQRKREYTDAVRSLQKKELVGFTEENGVRSVYLKEDGKTLALIYSLDELEIKKPKKWDKKWRIVAFDIPENRKSARNYFKKKLDMLGFAEIQKSVYVHPFDCKEEVDFVCAVFEIMPFVSLIVAESISNQERLIKRFNL